MERRLPAHPAPVGLAVNVRTGIIDDLAFSPDDRLLAVASEGALQLWRAAAGRALSLAANDPTPSACRIGRL